MSDVIIIEQDAKLLKNLKSNFKSKLQIDVVDKPNGKDTISLLQLITDFELIIVRWDACKEILNFLEKEQLTIPILVVGKKNSTYPYFYNLDSEITWENILTKAESIINKTESSSASAGSDKDFVAVSIFNFLALPTTKIDCDVYMKMKKRTDNLIF